MAMEQVTVRASQRFEDWADGEVRIVDRTRRIERLLRNEVLVEAPEAILDGPPLVYKRDYDFAPGAEPERGQPDSVISVEVSDATDRVPPPEYDVPSHLGTVEGAESVPFSAPVTSDRQPPPKRGRAPRTRQVDPEPDPEPGPDASAE